MINKNTWNDEWKDFKGLNFFGKKFAESQKKTVNNILEKEDVPKNIKIIDLGCGTGRTIKMFRDLRYYNSIGIDISQNSIQHCSRNGFIINKDVFLMDGTKTKFNDNSFDLVFADGVLEHFKDFTPFVKEMCRISKKYVLITQPNHFSLYGKILLLLNRKVVDEYTYKISDFENCFKKFDFKLTRKTSFNFNEQWALLFKKY